MKDELCSCCEGLKKQTPEQVFNRPGLDMLHYRVGTHTSFLESILARLSDLKVDYKDDSLHQSNKNPLQSLKTRAPDDPAIAFLDAWACVADVLTFYQERIANEAYLRTASERLSLVEMARLIGYRLRPGVAATAYLAFTLEKDARVEIPKGTRAKSLPERGDSPQVFETDEALQARGEWNELRPKLTRPQLVVEPETGIIKDVLYIQGINTNLKPNDPLLFKYVTDQNGEPIFGKIINVEVQSEKNRTKIIISLSNNEKGQPGGKTKQIYPFELLSKLSFNEKIIKIVENYKDYTKFGINAGSTNAEEVVKRLDQLEKLTPEKSSDKQIKALKSIFKEIFNLHTQFKKQKNWSKLVEWSEIIVAWLAEIGCELARQEVFSSKSDMPGSIPSFGKRFTFSIEKVIKGKEVTIKINNFPRGEPLVVIIGDIIVSAQPSGFGGVLRKSFQIPEAYNDNYVLRMFLVCPESGDFSCNMFYNQTKNEGWGSIDAKLGSLADRIAIEPSKQPINAKRLQRDAQTLFGSKTNIFPRLLTSFKPQLKKVIYQGLSKTNVPTIPQLDVSVNTLRIKAAPFGSNVPKKYDNGSYTEWSIEHEEKKILTLDAKYDGIEVDSWIVIERPVLDDNGNETNTIEYIFRKIIEVREVLRADYGIVGKVTQLVINDEWCSRAIEKKKDFSYIRMITVYARIESLELSKEFVLNDISGKAIDLDVLHDSLDSGRWVIISGERTDVKDEFDCVIPGIYGSELVMLAAVQQRVEQVTLANGDVVDLPSDKPHTTLVLANELAYTYKRDSVVIYGNVVKASQGETRQEVLGSGDGKLAFQKFTLKQKPLTYVPAPTPSGISSELEVRIQDVLWHEREHLFDLVADDRSYTLETDNDGQTTIIFGDGVHGSRLPTGVENIRAVYRMGIGKAGNVEAERITNLATRPLGVKSVTNPQAATGGADRESLSQARRNIPLKTLALDRLVSVQDYADFLCSYAGIGKALAMRLTDQHKQLIYITIAGAEDIPIDQNSALYRNMIRSIGRFGDPHQSFRVDLRELLVMVISAKVRLRPDYLWEKVEPKIRTALLEAFGFDGRALGQDTPDSEVLATIQAVEGVDYVDLDILDCVSFERLESFLQAGGEPESQEKPEELIDRLNLMLRTRITANLAAIDSGGEIHPAQLAILKPDLYDTVILTEITT